MARLFLWRILSFLEGLSRCFFGKCLILFRAPFNTRWCCSFKASRWALDTWGPWDGLRTLSNSAASFTLVLLSRSLIKLKSPENFSARLTGALAALENWASQLSRRLTQPRLALAAQWSVRRFSWYTCSRLWWLNPRIQEGLWIDCKLWKDWSTATSSNIHRRPRRFTRWPDWKRKQ